MLKFYRVPCFSVSGVHYQEHVPIKSIKKEKQMRFLNHLLAVIALCFVSVNAQAQNLVGYEALPSGTYVLDPTHASLIWKVDHLGLSDYTARFTDFEATLSYNAENPDQSSVKVNVNPLSVETHYPNPEQEDFNAKLAKGEDWFNGEAFPAITFQSTGLDITGDNEGVLTGNLTFLGVSKPVSLDVQFNGGYEKAPFSEAAKMGFSARGVIKRSDWGFTTYLPVIGDEVELLIEAEFVHQQD
jgi:polyisoprenoid-binding protein YceI